MQTLKLGDKLRTLRELHGIKQEDIAERLGISQNAYSKLETGESEITFKRLEEIAQVYNMKSTELINFDPKYVIHQTNHQNAGSAAAVVQGDTNNYFEKERKLYEQQIKRMQDEITFLKEMIEHLKK